MGDIYYIDTAVISDLSLRLSEKLGASASLKKLFDEASFVDGDGSHFPCFDREVTDIKQDLLNSTEGLDGEEFKLFIHADMVTGEVPFEEVNVIQAKTELAQAMVKYSFLTNNLYSYQNQLKQEEVGIQCCPGTVQALRTMVAELKEALQEECFDQYPDIKNKALLGGIDYEADF